MAKCSEILRTLFRSGWYVDRENGSHLILRHPKKSRKEDVIVFPNHGSKELGKGLLKKILKQAGIKKL